MAWFLGQSVLVIVAAFLVGLLVGWLWWGRRGSAASAGRSTVESPGSAPRAGAEAAPPVAGADELVAPVGLADEPEPELVEAAPEPEPEREAEPMFVEAAPEPEPALVEAESGTAQPIEPAVVVPDNLERIEGIGPKMAGALRAAGIHSYGQLADTDEPTLRGAIRQAGLRFAPSLVTWARQARLLADGDEAGFTDLTRRLVAGRDVGRS